MEMLDLPLEDHLDELRKRIIICICVAFVLLIPLLIKSEILLTYVFMPLRRLDIYVFSYHITDGLMLRIRTALITDVLILIPFIMFQGYLFMRPGLYPKERGLIKVLVPIGTVLFYGALALFYFKITPHIANYCLQNQSVSLYVSAERYLTIWQAIALSFGVIVAFLPYGFLMIYRLISWRNN